MGPKSPANRDVGGFFHESMTLIPHDLLSKRSIT